MVRGGKAQTFPAKASQLRSNLLTDAIRQVHLLVRPESGARAGSQMHAQTDALEVVLDGIL